MEREESEKERRREGEGEKAIPHVVIFLLVLPVVLTCFHLAHYNRIDGFQMRRIG